jgi:hypothetical protein
MERLMNKKLGRVQEEENVTEVGKWRIVHSLELL